MSIQPGPEAAASRRRTTARRTLVPYSADAVTVASVLVVAFSLGIYVRTLLPGTGFWDTAEAQTVPHTLSIFHPTGFPTYTLLGWAWSQLPLGEVAYRMNVFSAWSVALAAGLCVHITAHITAHLAGERQRLVQATAGGVSGLTFAFASEPWRNAVRADVHALHIAFVALIVWLLLCWGAAERSGSPHARRWLLAAALTFGVSLGNHALTGMLAFGIAAWLLFIDRAFWRRWRLILLGATFLLAGLSVYLYIPIRAVIDPEPPLFYARPDTLERLRYLLFAEQFSGLFIDFRDPLANIGPKWEAGARVLGAQFAAPVWALIGVGFALLAIRLPGAAAFLGLIAAVNVFYSMNFRDGDIDRYYLTTVLVAAPLLGLAIAAIATRLGAAAHFVARSTRGRFRTGLAAGVAGAVLVASVAVPAQALYANYARRDLSQNREATAWVESVHRSLPRNAVIISWWSYSTPLWYHRWVLGARPDVTIIDNARTILDEGYGDIHGAIDAFLGERPVYVVPLEGTADELRERYETETVETSPGYTSLLLIKDRSP